MHYNNKQHTFFSYQNIPKRINHNILDFYYTLSSNGNA